MDAAEAEDGVVAEAKAEEAPSRDVRGHATTTSYPRASAISIENSEKPPGHVAIGTVAHGAICKIHSIEIARLKTVTIVTKM